MAGSPEFSPSFGQPEFGNSNTGIFDLEDTHNNIIELQDKLISMQQKRVNTAAIGAYTP